MLFIVVCFSSYFCVAICSFSFFISDLCPFSLFFFFPWWVWLKAYKFCLSFHIKRGPRAGFGPLVGVANSWYSWLSGWWCSKACVGLLVGELGPTMAGHGAEVVLGLVSTHLCVKLVLRLEQTWWRVVPGPRDSGACAYPTVGQSWVLLSGCRALGVLVLVPTQWYVGSYPKPSTGCRFRVS